MSSTPLSLFALGSTGYIGGSALHGIFKAFPDLKVSALVRSEKDDMAVSRAFGNARIVRGSFSDLDLIEQEAAKADFVLNCADADNGDVVRSILKGLRARYKANPAKVPIYLHTSGTSVVKAGGDGSFVDAPILSDASIEEVKGIDANQPHRTVDLSIFNANDEGYVNAYIVAPSAIYGKGTGPVKRLTAQLPELILVAVKRKQAVHVGVGKNVWNFVHIEDLEELYVLVARLALSGTDTASSFGRFYVGSGELHEWGKVVGAVAPLLKARGKLPTDTVGSVTLKEEPGITGYLESTATNSRSKPDRGIALGWKPRMDGLWQTLEETVDMVIAEYNL